MILLVVYASMLLDLSGLFCLNFILHLDVFFLCVCMWFFFICGGKINVLGKCMSYANQHVASIMPLEAAIVEIFQCITLIYLWLKQ